MQIPTLYGSFNLLVIISLYIFTTSTNMIYVIMWKNLCVSLSMNHCLIMEEGLYCRWALLPTGRVSHGKLVQGEEPDKGRFRRPCEYKIKGTAKPLLRIGLLGPRHGAWPGKGTLGQAPGDRTLAYGAWPRAAQRRDME